MKTPDESNHRRRNALDYLENQIDTWNRTANNKKRVITIWRKRIALAMLIGAALGLASEEFYDWKYRLFCFGDEEFTLSEAFAVLSAIALALSTFAGAKILSGEIEKAQLNARAACEALKVQGYLYAMKAPPYSGKNAEKVLFKRIELISKDVSNIAPDLSHYTGGSSKTGEWLSVFYMGKKSKLPDTTWVQRFDDKMSFDTYVEERINGQINDYYRKKAAEFQSTINKANTATLVFGFMGVAFGAIGATYFPGISMWIGLLSTASASITSYIHANKYEFLLHSYVATASQLELISARYKSMDTPSLRMQQRFITETETIFATEHNSWLSEIAGTYEDGDEPDDTHDALSSDTTDMANDTSESMASENLPEDTSTEDTTEEDQTPNDPKE